MYAYRRFMGRGRHRVYLFDDHAGRRPGILFPQAVFRRPATGVFRLCRRRNDRRGRLVAFDSRHRPGRGRRAFGLGAGRRRVFARRRVFNRDGFAAAASAHRRKAAGGPVRPLEAHHAFVHRRHPAQHPGGHGGGPVLCPGGSGGPSSGLYRSHGAGAGHRHPKFSGGRRHLAAAAPGGASQWAGRFGWAAYPAW